MKATVLYGPRDVRFEERETTGRAGQSRSDAGARHHSKHVRSYFESSSAAGGRTNDHGLSSGRLGISGVVRMPRCLINASSPHDKGSALAGQNSIYSNNSVPKRFRLLVTRFILTGDVGSSAVRPRRSSDPDSHRSFLAQRLRFRPRTKVRSGCALRWRSGCRIQLRGRYTCRPTGHRHP